MAKPTDEQRAAAYDWLHVNLGLSHFAEKECDALARGFADREAAAFRRGAEAMRASVVSTILCQSDRQAIPLGLLRAIPIPEEK